MSLTVGTNTYVDLTDANQYWLDRNNSTWSSTSDADKQKALLEATQYIDNAYEFVGWQNTENVLAFPRNGVTVLNGNLRGVTYDSSVIPPQIINACCELALEAVSSRLRPAQERGGAVKKEKVDVIEVEYSDFAPSQKSYDFVTLLLKPLLSSGSGKSQTRLQRC